MTVKSENVTLEKIVQKYNCDIAMERNFKSCPISKVPTDFYGTITFKFENGIIRHTETLIKEKH